MQRRGYVIVGTLLLTALSVWAVWQLPMRMIGERLAQAHAGWLGVGVVAHAVIQLVASAQWWWLLPAVQWRAVLRVFTIGSVANNTANSLVGHATGTAMIAALPGVGAARAISMLALDQLCVGVAKVVVLLAAVPFALRHAVTWHNDLPLWISAGLRGVLVGVCLLTATLVIGVRLIPPRIIPTWLRSLVQAIGAVPPARLGAALLCALVVKVCEAVGIAAVQAAFGVTVTPDSVVLVLAATTVATFVPVMPANLGTYEAAVYAALVAYGTSAETALAIAVVQHVVQLTAAIVPGFMVSWRWVLSARR